MPGSTPPSFGHLLYERRHILGFPFGQCTPFHLTKHPSCTIIGTNLSAGRTAAFAVVFREKSGVTLLCINLPFSTWTAHWSIPSPTWAAQPTACWNSVDCPPIPWMRTIALWGTASTRSASAACRQTHRRTRWNGSSPHSTRTTAATAWTRLHPMPASPKCWNSCAAPGYTSPWHPTRPSLLWKRS